MMGGQEALVARNDGWPESTGVQKAGWLGIISGLEP